MRKIFLIILILSSLIGCVKDQFSFKDENNTNHRTHTDNFPSDNNVLGSWVVMFYEDLENGTIIYKSEVESMDLDVKLKFMDDSTFCGFNTTNEIAGHYTQQDSIIHIDGYGGSKVGQPEWGNMFSDIVEARSIGSFKRSSSQLKLYYNNHKNCITLYPVRRDIACYWTYSKN